MDVVRRIHDAPVTAAAAFDPAGRRHRSITRAQ